MAIKVGTEDKKKVYLASGLGLVMLILLVRFLWQNFGPSPSPAPAPPPVVTAPRPATTPSGGEAPQENTTAPAYAHPAAKVGGLAALDPTLHPEIMRQAESLEYTGTGTKHLLPVLGAPGDTQTDRSHPPGARRYRASTASATPAHQSRVLWLRGGEDRAKTSLPAARG